MSKSFTNKGVTVTNTGDYSSPELLWTRGSNSKVITSEQLLNGQVYIIDFDIAYNNRNFATVFAYETRERGGITALRLYDYDARQLTRDYIWVSDQTIGGCRPGIKALSDGSYLVVWTCNNLNGLPDLQPIETSDRYPEGIPRQLLVGRKVSADGRKLGETFAIGQCNLLSEGEPPEISIDANGVISVLYSEFTSDVRYKDGLTPKSGTVIGDNINGTFGGDYIYSLGGEDFVAGLDGNDFIDGGLDADTIEGGDGNDSMIGGLGNDVLEGGSGNDSVSAGDGEDVIVGGSGAGNDFYDGGGGVDIVRYLSALSKITIDFSKTKNNVFSTLGKDMAGIGTDTVINVEHVIAGNYDDTIIGSNDSNSLAGADGNDALSGRGGSDTLIGGAGSDQFIFNFLLNGQSNVDIIEDFEVGVDKIVLENAIFKKLNKTGVMAASFFATGEGAKSPTTHVVYENGTLFYDADGSKPGGAIAFAVIVGSPSISASDFLVI